MNRIKKRALTALIGVAVISLVITSVAASPKISGNTPLYAFRMEQASSKMNFLPTAVNGFVYTAEEGYNFNYSATGCCGDVKPLDTSDATPTCALTCYPTSCTCWQTCPYTCAATCPVTCDDPTCPNTCPVTCVPTCTDSCYQSCIFC